MAEPIRYERDGERYIAFADLGAGRERIGFVRRFYHGPRQHEPTLERRRLVYAKVAQLPDARRGRAMAAEGSAARRGGGSRWLRNQRHDARGGQTERWAMTDAPLSERHREKWLRKWYGDDIANAYCRGRRDALITEAALAAYRNSRVDDTAEIMRTAIAAALRVRIGLREVADD